MQLSPRCFAVTGLAYIPPWSVNAGWRERPGRIDDPRLRRGRASVKPDRGAEIHGHALIARTEAEFDEERAEFRSLTRSWRIQIGRLIRTRPSN
jgi:hypothetical protein